MTHTTVKSIQFNNLLIPQLVNYYLIPQLVIFSLPLKNAQINSIDFVF